MLEISSTNKIIGNTYSVVVPDIYEKFKIDGDAEVFETVALDYLLTKHADDTELIEYIMSLPKSDKRMATILAIDGDNVLWSKMNSFVNGCTDKFEHVKDVVKIINQFVKDGEVERKKYGEVMTPITLVREMLDTLPKEVWSNPNLKWLDPCNGAGTFPFVVIYKLMNGLKDWQPDVELRYKHIVENMIYTCELQSRNVALWLCGVDPKDEYTTNTYWGSFIDDGFDYHMKNVWNVDKFDIVIGNPPYQDNTDKSKGTTGKKNLYQQFINKSISNLIIDGFLLFVNPPGFLKTTVFEKSTDIFKTFQSLNLIYLNLSDINDKYFKVGTPICYFLLQKNDLYKSTNIITDNSTVYLDIRNFNFVPRLLFNETYSILEKISKKGKKFSFKRDSKIVGPNFITMKRLNHINKNGKMNPIVGGEFKYDLTLECEYPEKMCDILNHKIYRFLNYTLRHDGVIYHYFINGLCYPHNYENENDLYDYFGLTENEINLIEKIISD